jgi:dTDP-4-amino-4,6-dideoxygalactose transaminase
VTQNIALSDIPLDENDIAQVVEVLKSKWLSMGPITQNFEKEFSDYNNVKHSFGVSNGTAALHIAVKELGIKQGDEVILPSLTFVATANSILYCRAKPVFADITSYKNFNISPESIVEKISKKTKAIIAVHYGGYPCDMKAILDIAADHNLTIIEDAAHAVGAEYRGKKCGTIGDIGCFSFFANKNLATGEGGMIVTNHDDIARKINIIRSHGMTTLTWDRHKGHAYSYDVVDLGYNYRISEIASSLGRTQLKKLDNNNKIRREITEKYQKQLTDSSNIQLPFLSYEGLSAYHIFPILLKNFPREKFMMRLKDKGIQTSIHYKPIHQFSYYKKMVHSNSDELSKTEYVGNHEVTIPLHPLLHEEEILYVTNTIKDTIAESNRI